jgi:hypothetical protein
MVYADDILILPRTKKSLTEALQQLKKSSIEVGLKINEEKTKYTKCSKKDTNNEGLNRPNRSTEQVHQCKYLGCIINDNNSIEEEIKERIVLGTKAYYANLKFFKKCYYALGPILKRRSISQLIKIRIYKTIIRPAVIY